MRTLLVTFVGFVVVVSCCTASFAQATNGEKSSDEVSFGRQVRSFLSSHCFDCHGESEQKADRRFDVLDGRIEDSEQLVDYQDILDQLNLGAMPPEDVEQPSGGERRTVVEWLTTAIDDFHKTRSDSGGDTVLRRLNSREYRNTLRDLLKIDITIFDPTIRFPQDETVHHLDNNGQSLVTSGYLLRRYIEAADKAVEKALFPRQKPGVQTWRFTDGFRQQPEIDQVHRKWNEFKHLTLYDVIGADKPEGAYAPIHAFAEGVPFDGVYEIKFLAEALNRLHEYDEAFLGIDREQPFRLGIRPGDHTVCELHLPQPIEPLLADVELADEKKWYTVRVPLEKGYTPRFTFRNGLMDARNLWSRVVKRYPERFEKGLKGIVQFRRHAIQYGDLPQIRIHEVEIRGPIHDTWPTESQRLILGPDCEQTLETAEISLEETEQLVRKFANRAFRRKATDDEIQHVMTMIRSRRTAGDNALEAMAHGLKAVLCSPSFLYLEESQAEELSPTALASRLSYFLWSTMPDSRLLDLATKGSLTDTTQLRKEVARMLEDSRSDAFVRDFLDSWLTLRDLGAAPPDRSEFKDYYRHDLRIAMSEETFHFTRHVLDENLSIDCFLDSDFTFVNRPLARHYGIPTPTGTGFQRVSLTDRRRGGLLGQGSVLTVTANGIETSPVVRGVWLLENILGTPPSPPPPDVEPLDPDTRGATTIREQLDRHRNVSACFDCHRKIDPLGFALESFDPIGAWRKKYPNRTKIDTAGELPGGRTFDGIVGLKAILKSDSQQFQRALAGKLLAYATGRSLHPTDRPHIDAMLRHEGDHPIGFAELVVNLVLSEPFRSK